MAYGLRKIGAGTADSMTAQADGTCTIDIVCTQMSKPAAGGEPRVIPTATALTNSTETKFTTDPATDNDDVVTQISIANTHATITSLVTVRHKIATGTARAIFTNVALKPGDHLEYGENGVWMHYDQTLGVYTALAIALSRTVVTSGSGTYSPPAGCRAINVRGIAGGGAGGGAASVASGGGAGAGGGSGSYFEKLISPPASSYSYAIGAGGTPGAAGANAGGNGVDTTFGTLTAKAGTGGAGMASGTTILGALGGAGGVVGTNGDINPAGEPGGLGIRMTGLIGASGSGGSSVLGTGANGLIAQGTGAAAVANSGGGGSGGLTLNAGAATAGGAGGSGIILVEEWF